MADNHPKPTKWTEEIGKGVKKAFGIQRWNDRKEANRKKVEEEGEAAKVQAMGYTHFRILVIGRANAGKTTLLKRVCNTTEEPSIYEGGKSLLEPTSKRGVHKLHHAFTFASNPRFVFHDSAGFESGGVKELRDVMAFIAEKSKSINVNDQIHAIWFCFEPDVARPLLPLEKSFFSEGHAQNVPVVAIFMKFDDLITQVYNINKNKEENNEHALKVLQDRFQQPLSQFKFPPRAYVRFEALHDDTGNHQEQVGELIRQTAASLDSFALKKLFINIQQNNINISVEFAVNK